jgi:membrane-associated phospholipid phosphatase
MKDGAETRTQEPAVRSHRHAIPEAGATTHPAAERRFFIIAGLVVYAIWLIAYEAVGQYVATLPTIDLTSAYDRVIPRLPGFVWAYVFCYIFPFLPLAVTRDWHRFNRGLVAIVLANLTAFLVYVAYPVAVPREPLGHTISDRLLAFIYLIDFKPAVTALPSLHVTFAWLVHFMCRRQSLRRWGEAVTFVVAAMITLSTLFVKQHVIVDVVAGLALSGASWMVGGRFYRRITADGADARTALLRLPRKLAPILMTYLALILIVILINELRLGTL